MQKLESPSMADGTAKVTGYCIINVLESAGHDSEDQGVWEPDFKSGYARGELRRWRLGRRRSVSWGKRRLPVGMGGRRAGRSVQPSLHRTFIARLIPAVEIRGGAKTIKVWQQVDTLCMLRTLMSPRSIMGQFSNNYVFALLPLANADVHHHASGSRERHHMG